MGCKALTATLVVVLVLLAPTPAIAGDYIMEVVQALERASVYVAAGTEGTDHDTAARLKSRLRSNDNIVLVMLPTTAEGELGADIFTVANRLSENLGDQKIIGLAIGRNVIGYAQVLPAGVAADLMKRAKSVSNDPVTALITFTQNVQLWQRENPQPTPTFTPSPTPTPSPTRSPESIQKAREDRETWAGWSFLAVFVLFVAFQFFKIIRNLVRRREDGRDSFF